MALLSKLGLVSYPEAVALTDLEERFLVEELKINLLQLAMTNPTVQGALKEQMAPSIKGLRAQSEERLEPKPRKK